MPVQKSLSSLLLPSVTEGVADIARWRSAVADLGARHGEEAAVTTRSRAFIDSSQLDRLISDVVAGRHQPLPSRRMELNKAGPRKKVVYQLQLEDELLCRVLNRLLQPLAEQWISPHCHSFRPGRSAVTAFASLLQCPDIDGLGSLHVDIADFFNSIDVDDLLASLPSPVRADPVLMPYLTALLRDTRVCADGALLEEPNKGVMAGTPLAPLLSNLYLRSLDDAIASLHLHYARYSDDMLVLGGVAQLDAAERRIRGHLSARALRVNEHKTLRTSPGEPWDFLGLRYMHGHIGLSANTMRKVRAKVRRRARRLARHRQRTRCDPAITSRLFVSSLNRTLYGVRARGDVDFSWSRWFFPLLTTSEQLADLDAYVQREVRWAMSGTRRARVRSAVTYEVLRGAGYIPLRTAYSAYRSGGDSFLRLLESRSSGRVPR